MTDVNNTPTQEELQNQDQPTETTSVETDNQEVEDKNWRAVRAKLKAEQDEKAKLEAKLQAYEEEKKRKEEEKLKEQGEYQKLLEQRELELAELRQNIKTQKAQKTIVNELAKHNLNPEALDLIENKALELAQTDENGNVTNLSEVVEGLQSNYSFLFNQKGVKVLSSTPQATTNGSLTIEDIKKMPLSERPKNWESLILNS